jgi:predicted nucleic acid-binding protein
VAYLADTNVAMRRVLPADPACGIVTAAIDKLREDGQVIYITPQILIEFHALATRPVEANGLGLTLVQAGVEAAKMEAIFPMLPEAPGIYSRWRALVTSYQVMGRQVYDARLVAVMQTYGVTHLLTMNAIHFRRFSSIVVTEPGDVV